MGLNIIDGMALIKHTGIRGEKFLILSLIAMTAGRGLSKVFFNND
jgi:NhaP-type Na+/H+ and K+/H+ antiporter